MRNKQTTKSGCATLIQLICERVSLLEEQAHQRYGQILEKCIYFSRRVSEERVVP